MNQNKPIYYFTPALLAVIIFGSNFLNTDLFNVGFQDFTAWFIMAVFAFACGWLMNETFGYIFGGKLVFAVIVSTSFLSVMMVLLFSNYFGINDPLAEKVILYSLRSISIGAMGFFGMAVNEVIRLQRIEESLIQKNGNKEKELFNIKKEADLIIKEAKMNADMTKNEAANQVKLLKDKKKKLEEEITGFINTEKELIKLYESKEKK